MLHEAEAEAKRLGTLRLNPQLTAEPPVLPALKLPLSQASLLTLPGPEGWDGFFAARLRRLY